MKRSACLLLLASSMAAGCGSQPTQEVEFTPEQLRQHMGGLKLQQAALDRCRRIIAAEVGGSPETVENHGSNGEFYFAWRNGTIPGGTRNVPDTMTGSMEASASCIGSFPDRQVTQITVNGRDIEAGLPAKF